MNSFGIDLSHWNRTIEDLDAGVKFVLHKVTEGATFQDPLYLENRGFVIGQDDVVWGAYHVIRESSTWNDQFANFYKHAKLRPGDVAVVDLEHKWAEAMVEKHGAVESLMGLLLFGRLCYTAYKVRPLLYASKRSLGEIIEHVDGLVPIGASMQLATYYDLWWVAYDHDLNWQKDTAPVLSFWPEKPIMRQYTDKGRGSIIGRPRKEIDCDVCYDLAKLKWHAVKYKEPRI